MKRPSYLAGKLLSGIVFFATLSVAQADNLAPDKAKAVRLVVQSQLSALADGDADKAFALTTPAVREQLGSPENLLMLVKQEYDPLLRNRGLIYQPAEEENGEVTQTVRVTDLDDHVWLVVYEMKLQTDGAWRIDGWDLLETETISV